MFQCGFSVLGNGWKYLVAFFLHLFLNALINISACFHQFPQITRVLVFQFERRPAWSLLREEICTFDRWVL